ncbi:MAG TPA: PLP-dependent transferase [Gaiellaceae bacterium]|nr:PLP-dependent transferase [Gaiellaceae bacterium]
MNTETLACHAGREDFSELTVHAPPLDFSSTYPLRDLDEATAAFDALAEGAAPTGTNPVYARLHNPTVRRFETALAELEGTVDAVAFASGMAALTATLLAACEERRHVVALRPLYGGSDHLLACGLLGLEVTWARSEGDVAGARRRDTGVVLLETPQNPTLGVVDIAAVVSSAGDVPVLVDNTFATPILQNPAAHGAAYVLHSATKFLGGHGDVVAGVVATSSERASRLRQVRILTGAILHPMGAYLLHRSLPTLPLRVRAAQQSAGVLARRLAAHSAVERVLYPRPDGVQLRGAGAILSFEVAGGLEAASRVMGAVNLVTPAVSLGSTDTLIQHPAGLTHRLLDPNVRSDLGITDGLLRLSVGLEDAEDLWDDLAHALAATRVRVAA